MNEETRRRVAVMALEEVRAALERFFGRVFAADVLAEHEDLVEVEGAFLAALEVIGRRFKEAGATAAPFGEKEWAADPHLREFTRRLLDLESFYRGDAPPPPEPRS